jgi:hypothetical protein
LSSRKTCAVRTTDPPRRQAISSTGFEICVVGLWIPARHHKPPEYDHLVGRERDPRRRQDQDPIGVPPGGRQFLPVEANSFSWINSLKLSG